MFPGFDPQALLAQAQAMQQQLADTQAALADERVEGSAGGGLVVAVCNGSGDLVTLQLNPSVLDPNDAETVADLVVAAVRDAQEGVRRLSASRLGLLTQGFGDFGAAFEPALPAVVIDESDDDAHAEEEDDAHAGDRPARARHADDDLRSGGPETGPPRHVPAGG